MTQQAPRTPERHELVVTLQGLRVDAKLSTTELAKLLSTTSGREWSQSRVSRIERGVTLATPEDVDAWTTALKTPTDTRRHLMNLADESRTQFVKWRSELGSESARRQLQEEIRGFEAGASVIRLFGADVVPGLAQTRAYAARMVLLGHHDDTDDTEDLDALLDVRMGRQDVLDTGKHIRLLMSETALRRHLLSGPMHLDQIERLLRLTPRPNVHLGVIPFDADEVEHQYLQFAILGDPDTDDNAIVLAETPTRGLRVRDLDEIAEYVRHYERLDSTAVHGDELRALLLEIAEYTTWL